MEPEFHRLARTPIYRWWKPLVELIAFGGLSLLLWLIAVPALGELFDGAHDGAAGMISMTVMLALMLPASLFAAMMLGRRPGALSSVVGGLRWRWLRTCVVAAAAIVVASIVVQIILLAVGVSLGPPRGGWVGFAEFLPLALIVIVFVPFQAAAEEYAFRGTLLQAVGAWVRPPWFTIAVSSILFAIAHGFDPVILVAIGVSGVVFAWVTIRTGGLEAAIALHVMNNVTAFLFDAGTGRGNKWLTELNTDIPWYGIVVDVVMNVGYALLIERLWTARSGRATS